MPKKPAVETQQETWEKIQQNLLEHLTIGGLYGPDDWDDLAGEATAAAAKVLTNNWSMILAEGHEISDVIADVDAVIERLQLWRVELESNYTLKS